MPERSRTYYEYRYGLNGKENEMDFREKGRQLDYGARIYDARLGRFLSIDQLQKKYPGESNYAFVSNNPILYLDQEGKDKIITHVYMDERGNILRTIKLTIAGELKGQAIQVRNSIDKSDWHWEYQWRDISQSVTHVMKNGSEISRSVSGETLGKVRTTTDVNSAWWAQQKIAWKDNEWSGIMFYGENGQGQESKHTPYPVKMENIGKLLAAVDGMKDIGKIDILENTFLKYASKGSTAEALDHFIERIDLFMKFYDSNTKLKEATGSSPFDPKELPGAPSGSADPSILMIEPAKPKPKPLIFNKYVDTIPGVSPQYNGPWSSHRGAGEGKPDTIINYKVKTDK